MPSVPLPVVPVGKKHLVMAELSLRTDVAPEWLVFVAQPRQVGVMLLQPKPKHDVGAP
jgi:hypothetical protein